MAFTLLLVPGTDPRFLSLCAQLDSALNAAVGAGKQQALYARHNTTESIPVAALVLESGQPAGCAAFRALSQETAELKRVFVQPACRGKGYGRVLVEAVEQAAKARGFQRLVLETGRPLLGAIRLYRRLGYQEIENYDPMWGWKAPCVWKKGCDAQASSLSVSKKRYALFRQLGVMFAALPQTPRPPGKAGRYESSQGSLRAPPTPSQWGF